MKVGVIYPCILSRYKCQSNAIIDWSLLLNILGIKITKNKAEIPTDQLVTSIMGWDRVVRGLFISDLHPFYK